MSESSNSKYRRSVALRVVVGILLIAAGISVLIFNTDKSDRLYLKVAGAGILLILYGAGLLMSLITSYKQKIYALSFDNVHDDTIDVSSILESYASGEIDRDTLLKKLCRAAAFHTSESGVDDNGNKMSFLLAALDGTYYVPVFTSTERLKGYMASFGCSNYISYVGNMRSVLAEILLKTLDKDKRKFGIILDPGYCEITVEADELKKVVDELSRIK